MSIYKHFGRLRAFFNNFNTAPLVSTKVQNGDSGSDQLKYVGLVANKFHNSARNCDLMEFFDSKENWNATSVKVGRAWKLDELRIKSNSDLHKLWYVLLKERNMLLTMEHEYKEQYIPMPNPERIHKVNESMKNLETVVRERNRAYYQLETGESGEREIVNDHNGFGLPIKRKLREHFIEKRFNEKYKKFLGRRHNMIFDKDVIAFLKLYNEKQNKLKYARTMLQYKEVCELFRRFSNIDEEALKEKYPDVDIEKAKKDKRSRGPWQVHIYTQLHLSESNASEKPTR